MYSSCPWGRKEAPGLDWLERKERPQVCKYMRTNKARAAEKHRAHPRANRCPETLHFHQEQGQSAPETMPIRQCLARAASLDPSRPRSRMLSVSLTRYQGPHRLRQLPVEFGRSWSHDRGPQPPGPPCLVDLRQEARQSVVIICLLGGRTAHFDRVFFSILAMS